MIRFLSLPSRLLATVAFVSALGLFSLSLAGQLYAGDSGKEDGENVLLVLGDSLSAAYKMPEEDGWVSLLAERLASSTGSKKEQSYRVINGSISGATTAAGLRSLPSLLEKYKPDLVILELGANDGLQGKPIRYISTNLSKLLQQIKNAGADSVVVGVHMPPNYGKAYTEPFFKQYKTLSKKYGSGYVPFLLEGVAQDRTLMMSDGLHPKPEAQMRILNNVWPVLQPLL